MGRPPILLTKERLLSKREIKPSPDGRFQDCWYWTGNLINKKYGQIFCAQEAFYVHRVAAFLWLNFDLNSDLCVCHKCDNPPCFNPEHLFIGTNSDNLQDMIKKGRSNYLNGERNGMNKITIEDMLEIRRLCKEGNLAQIDIAHRFNISQKHVSQIHQRTRWKHVKENINA